MKHVVCYSGGHSSALVAIEVVRRFGKDDVILLNHDINPSVEDVDIKRFKQEVADHLGLPITFANFSKYESKDQIDVCLDHGGFLKGNGSRASMSAACTTILKTEPFQRYLEENFADKNCTIYYGFDANETKRIQRRSSILGLQGYKTDYPLALWERTIHSTEEVGITPPLTYSHWKHANCQGCLKGGRQHWYVTFCHRPDIFEKAKAAEDELGYTIIKGVSLAELEPMFERMKELNIEATEKTPSGQFWSQTKKLLKQDVGIENEKPCECMF